MKTLLTAILLAGTFIQSAAAAPIVEISLPKFELALPALSFETSLWQISLPQKSFSLLPDTAAFYDVSFDYPGAHPAMDFRELPSEAGHPSSIHGNFDLPGPGYRQQGGGYPSSKP